ncbi:RNA polymerase sigma-70 factor [Streptomyces spectabilis]|uniref:RNA polymerase sigma-70 factor n=1 Tax=Streptomyces spectabilis TaxID=68270 RepID=A0A5P2X955_STRST|nr:RNA polymerase sigma-70 factor [Streptomyces spectabilis]MBB5103978.1 RNA polymerase sigma-70 factor (ECF subfamily) [Streptomyces spectabilis]MCI3903787.1 RNA polymerase sigma-70 factor [Streptomyces spectabilis]QEV60961.1 RNA polymerase sigma-70 factor [Streptomyces spectabilis]GGV40398.1 RNA polymerase sigma24 factor [Streptomyces spectabilis]
MDRLATYEENRARLFGLAYRLLGEAAEAEDVLQDAYVRWADSGPVEVPAAWLTKVVTNLCLNRLSSARARRESYVGPWLPEPVFTDGGQLGPLETVEQRDSVSVGLLVLLERLTPAERAAFVLREAFGYPHADIAEVLDVPETRVRQLYRRAREHVQQPRRRFVADPEHRVEIVRRFLAAAAEGDVAGLEQLLAKDVVAWADGGGQVSAARRPVAGADKVARLLIGIAAHPRAAGAALDVRTVNGGPAIVAHLAGELIAVLHLEIENGLVTAVRNVVNPAKLAFASAQPV